MKILITGFDGFIGSHLCDYLKDKYDIFGITRYAVGKKIKVDFPYAFVDLTQNFQVKNILKEVKPDVIIHLAAQSSVSRSFERPEEYMETNLIGTINMAENAMREVPNLKKFIHASTPEVYGNQKTYPVNEGAFPNPTTPYAVSKFAADLYLLYMFQAYNFPIVISRHANCYGRKEGIFSNLGVVENIITQMLKGKEVNLGNPDASRDFIFIDDITEWYNTLIERGKEGEIYNIGHGFAWKIKDVAGICKTLIGWKGTVNYNTLPKRPGEFMKIELNSSKAIQELGFIPKISLEMGLQKTINYWNKHEND
jgi:UDP-glucose 4-epimerase